MLIYNGHPRGSSFFFNDEYHLEHAHVYHATKQNIDLNALESFLSDFERQVLDGCFVWDEEYPEQAMDDLLVEVEGLIGAPLPQEWSRLFQDLKRREINGEYSWIDTYASQIHCPKGVSNAGQKTSATGLAKAVGTESALYGLQFI